MTWLAMVLMVALADSWRGDMAMGPARIAIEVRFGEAVCQVDLPDLNVFGFPMQLERTNNEVALTGRSPVGAVSMTGLMEGDEMSGVWSMGPRAGDFRLVRTDDEGGVIERPVSIESGDVTLAASLVLPRGEVKAGMVWVHGSGGIGRRSTSYTWPAQLLARHGVASIVYDKRGVGGSSGDWRDATFEALAEDAIAARDVLAATLGVEPASIGAGGVSQGPTWIIPLAMSMDGGFGFFVAMSPAGVDPATQHLHVVEHRMRRADAPADAIGAALALHRRCDQVQRTGEQDATLPTALARAAEMPWFESSLLPRQVLPLTDWQRSWMWLDPVPLWQEIDVPVLLCLGSADEIVDAQESRRLLSDAPSGQVTVRMFEGADHLLTIEQGGMSFAAPGLHETLVVWVNERAGDQPRP